MRETRSKDSRPRLETTPTSPTTSTRRRKSTKKMNVENYATVEVKHKSAKEEARYDLAERGETKPRNFEKPDKPDDKADSEQKHVADTLSSLPPEDLWNIALLMLLCTSTRRLC